MNDKDWYSENIEEPLRELIKYLRNNGVNTECSCGHDLYIQCQYIPDGNIKEIQNLIYNWLNEYNEKINFKIKIIIEVIDGKIYPTLEIKLNPGFGSYNKDLIKEQIEYHKKMLIYFKKRLKNKLYR